MYGKLTMTMFWEMTIELKLLNQFQWSWYHSFQKTMFYLMKSKYAIFSNIRVMKIERSAFWGHPIYWQIKEKEHANLYLDMTRYLDWVGNRLGTGMRRSLVCWCIDLPRTGRGSSGIHQHLSYIERLPNRNELLKEKETLNLKCYCVISSKTMINLI